MKKCYNSIVATLHFTKIEKKGTCHWSASTRYRSFELRRCTNMIAVVSQMVRCVILFLKIEKAPAQPGKNTLFQAIILFQHARNSWEKRCFSQQDKIQSLKEPTMFRKITLRASRCIWRLLDVTGQRKRLRNVRNVRNVAGCQNGAGCQMALDVKWQNGKMSKSQNRKMSECQNGKMSNCQNVKMSKWQNVRMPECQNVKMEK